MDVGSTCGTFVNGESLERNKVQRLAPGDTISLGSTDTQEAGTYHYRVVQPSAEEEEDTDDECFDDTPAPSPEVETEEIGQDGGLTGYESEPEKKPLETESDENVYIGENQIKVEVNEDSKHVPVIRECFVRLPSCIELEKESFVCELCDFSSVDRGSLNIHIQEQHIEISYPCDECDYSADSQDKLVSHVVSIHENVGEELKDSTQVNIKKRKKFKTKYCAICEKDFSTREKFREHYNRVHLKIKFPCKQCDYSANYKNLLNNHIEMKHGGQTFRCQLCESEFKAKYYLREHLKRVHKKSYYCDQCPHRARNPALLAWHKETAHSDNEINCELCDFICKHKKFLDNHMKTMHEEKRFICQQCGSKFGLQGSLNRHLRESHNNTEFICDQCDFTSKSKITFKRHMNKMHLGIKYKCKLCDHESVSARARLNHVKDVHDNVRYPCHICDHVAKNKSNLKNHLEREDHGGRGTSWRLKELGIKQKNYRKNKKKEVATKLEESNETLSI